MNLYNLYRYYNFSITRKCLKISQKIQSHSLNPLGTVFGKITNHPYLFFLRTNLALCFTWTRGRLQIAYACSSMLSCGAGGATSRQVAGGCWVQSGVTLALLGCLLVTLACLAGLGCSMALGLPFNVATTQILPFLALGLGVNDLFLLSHNYVSIISMVDRCGMWVCMIS